MFICSTTTFMTPFMKPLAREPGCPGTEKAPLWKRFPQKRLMVISGRGRHFPMIFFTPCTASRTR